MPHAVRATNLNQCLCSKPQRPTRTPDRKRMDHGDSGTLQFTWHFLHHGHSGSCQQGWAGLLRSYSLHFPWEESEAWRDKGTGLPEVTRLERPGMLRLFLQRQKRKQSKVAILFSQSHTKTHYVSEQREHKCKILPGRRTDPETGESQKVETEEDNNTGREFQLTSLRTGPLLSASR